MSDWCPENDGAYRAEMAEVAKITMEANLSRALIAEKRIRELEVENERLHDKASDLGVNLNEGYERNIRAEAAEAEVARLKARACNEIEAHVNRRLAAESKLRAVAELPDKWRERADDMAWRWARAADELEALLKKRDYTLE